MYTHILTPIDGSELSKMALEEGVALAKALGARVTVVTVTMPFNVITGNPEMLTHDVIAGGTEMFTPVITGNPEMIKDTPERYEEHMAALAERYLDVGKNIATAAGVACDLVHVEHEHPYKAIIDTAQNRGCDAIEMASHGRGGMSAILLGSETLKVLTHSTIPVIVCRRPPLATLARRSFAS